MKAFIISTLLVLQSLIIQAQDCGQVYSFNINDKTSYSISCGVQDQSDWVVRKNSCNFYSPLSAVSGKAGDADRLVDINIRLRSSGNLDDNDFAWIFYYINGKTEVTKTIKGSEMEELLSLRDSILVPAGGNFKIRVAFVCDGNDEFWKLSNGDLTTCIRKVPGETIADAAPVTGKISVLHERNIVKLSWNAPSGPNGNYFVIERSKNGTQFEFAGYVKDNKGADTISKYSFIDSGSFQPETWYRISQVDMSGKSAYFGKPVSIKL